MIISKSINYYQKKKAIDKAVNRNTAYKIQFYNNRLIDEYVTNYDDGLNIKPPLAEIWANLSIMNKPQVYKNYNRIINSPHTSNDNLDKILIRNMANKDLNRIVESELERIVKNLDYVEEVLAKYDIPAIEYEKAVKEQANKSVANRRQILEDVAVKANDLLVSEGLNIPSNVFSYRDLDITAESLMRQSQMTSSYEEKIAINEEYENEGKEAPYTKKKWIWTGAGVTTRHESNNMQEVGIDEPFIVVNDVTLDIDELMYPSDPSGSPSNVYICYCDVEYF